jgi:hypothetical protein
MDQLDEDDLGVTLFPTTLVDDPPLPPDPDNNEPILPNEVDEPANALAQPPEEIEDYITPQGARMLRCLQTFYNPNPFQHIPTANLSTLYDGNPDPKSFLEAQSSDDWPNWREAMAVEFKAMHEKQVWTIIRKSDIPSNRKVIGNRWVYVQKDDGRFRARTVAQGFTQVPGKDFQENHSPTLNPTTLHTVLILKLIMGLEAGQFDVETAFLYGELEEKLYMDLPDGYIDFLSELIKNGKTKEIPITIKDDVHTLSKATHCVELLKAIYGLVQAARQWWKKFKEVLLSIGYKSSLADPCLFIKDNNNNQKSFIVIYVDDGGIFSNDKNIKEVIDGLSKHFTIKYLGKMETFLGCKIIENDKKDTIWIHQPKLLKNLKKVFGKLIENTKSYKTPAAPKTSIIRPDKDFPLISSDDQKLFRSGVGMLLYLIKYSRPDISNAVRELSKVADGATEAHWKSLLRTIKYVIDTENKALKLQPKIKDNNLFYLEGFSDSNFADDKDTRTSVYGYVLYFCGAPIATKSKLSRSVTQSSTEAEYFAVSEVAKEILFVKQLLETIGIKTQLPIVIRVDNVGAIFLGNNFSVGQRTKHIDIRAHFIREYIENGVLTLVFVRTDDNDADLFTKNLSEDTYIRHSEKLIEDFTTFKQGG